MIINVGWWRAQPYIPSPDDEYGMGARARCRKPNCFERSFCQMSAPYVQSYLMVIFFQ